MKSKKRLLILLAIVIILLTATACFAYVYYKKFFYPNIHPKAPTYLYIPSNTTYASFTNLLEEQGILKDLNSFLLLAKYKKLEARLHPGRYKVSNTMSNNDLINKIRAGNQDEVHFIFNNIRTKNQLAHKIASQLEIDSLHLMALLNDDTFTANYNFTTETILCMFIPNTYHIFWNISDTAFMQRMFKEYQNFWTDQRRQKAQKIGLSPLEVSILASIVEEENYRKDEQVRIAGVYINRLKKGMLLQADPSVKFALGDPSIKRLLLKDLEIDSPYNTYKYPGLPPGPIRIPETSSIDAVLNYEKHNYLYMCAKEDFSGYHNFAVSAHQHAINARKYQQALNHKKIRR